MIPRQSTLIRVLLGLLLLSLSWSFTPTKNVLTTTPSRIPTVSSNLFTSPPKRPTFLSMTAEESKDQEETEGAAAKNTEAVLVEDDEDTEGKRSIAKTILLTVPLFCKFVIVLLIKFVTDLVVFPLLFLYRLAGTAKRTVMKKFGGQHFDKVNGSHRRGDSRPSHVHVNTEYVVRLSVHYLPRLLQVERHSVAHFVAKSDLRMSAHPFAPSKSLSSLFAPTNKRAVVESSRSHRTQADMFQKKFVMEYLVLQATQRRHEHGKLECIHTLIDARTPPKICSAVMPSSDKNLF